MFPAIIPSTGFNINCPSQLISKLFTHSSGKLNLATLPDDAIYGALNRVTSVPSRIGPTMGFLAGDGNSNVILSPIRLGGRLALYGTGASSYRMGHAITSIYKELIVVAQPAFPYAANSCLLASATQLCFSHKIAASTSVWLADANVGTRWRDNQQTDTNPISSRLAAYRIQSGTNLYGALRFLNDATNAAYQGYWSGLFGFSAALTTDEANLIHTDFRMYWNDLP